MFDYDKYTLENEIWKDIPRYEGLYQASNFGRIRSVEGKETFTKHHGIRKWKGKILKNKTKTPKKEGYKVTLWKDGKNKDWLVARLICTTFHGLQNENANVNEKMTVNHKNGNRFDNTPENLEWLTITQNIRHGFENGLYPQKSIVIKGNDGIERYFRSLSQASLYLNHGSGYISNAIKKGIKIYKGSEEYHIVKII